MGAAPCGRPLPSPHRGEGGPKGRMRGRRGCFAAPAATHFANSGKVGKTPFKGEMFRFISPLKIPLFSDQQGGLRSPLLDHPPGTETALHITEAIPLLWDVSIHLLEISPLHAQMSPAAGEERKRLGGLRLLFHVPQRRLPLSGGALILCQEENKNKSNYFGRPFLPGLTNIIYSLFRRKISLILSWVSAFTMTDLCHAPHRLKKL